MPWFTEARTIYYRKDVLKKAGVDPATAFTDWDAFRTTLEKIKQVKSIGGEKIEPFGSPGKKAFDLVHHVMPFVWDAGGAELSADNTKSTIDLAAGRAGREVHRRPAVLGRLYDKSQLERDGTQVENQFKGGRSPSGSVARGCSARSSAPTTRTGSRPHATTSAIAPMPAGPEGKGYTFVGGSNLMMFKSSKNKDAAWALMKFLSQDQVQTDYAAMLGMFPSRMEPQKLAGEANANYGSFFKAIQQGRTYAPIPQWGQIENAYKTRFGNILEDAGGRQLSDADITKELRRGREGGRRPAGPGNGLTLPSTGMSTPSMTEGREARLVSRPAPRTRRRVGAAAGRRRLAWALIAPAALFMVLVHGLPDARAASTSPSRSSTRSRSPSCSTRRRPAWTTTRRSSSTPTTRCTRASSARCATPTIYTVFTVGGTLGGGLAVALLLNRPIRGQKLVRTLMLTPWIVPSFVVALLWQFMWQSDVGIVNKVLVDYTGLLSERPVWLSGANSLWAIIIPSIWRGLPFAMLIFLAGLQAIPHELDEAAAIDGAGPWRRFRHITLPLLRPLIAVQLLFGVIYAAYQYAIPVVMLGTTPGPHADLMMTLIVRQSFSNNLFGFGAAASVAADARDARVGRRLVPHVPARPGGRQMTALALSPRTRRRLGDRALDALTWLVLAVMLAPIFWLVAASLQNELRLATGELDLLHPTLDAFRDMWQTVDFERYFVNSARDLRRGGGAGHGVRGLGRLRARALPLPRRAAVRAGGRRHAADPRLDVPAAGLHGLHLAQAEHADRAVRHPARDGARLHGVLHAGGDLLHALVLPRPPARARGGRDGRRLLAVRGVRADRAAQRAAGAGGDLRLRVPVRVGRAAVRRGADADAAETIPIGIRNFIGNYSQEYDQLMAAGVVSTLPVLVAFFFTQRWLVRGLTAGAVKG